MVYLRATRPRLAGRKIGPVRVRDTLEPVRRTTSVRCPNRHSSDSLWGPLVGESLYSLGKVRVLTKYI